MDKENDKKMKLYGQFAWILNYQPKIEHQHIHFGKPSNRQQTEETVDEEPLKNIIFNERLFNSNARLAKLRDTIAAAIDMGDATIMYGKPQEMRINPSVQS